MYLAAFRETGHRLAKAGLISGANGNLSIRLNNHILITAHGSKLDSLMPSEIVETAVEEDDANTPLASYELPVHRAIYRATPARAIVHAHPTHTVSLSLADNAKILAGVPVLGTGGKIIPGLLASEIATALKISPLVMVRGHGSFAAGKTLDEALRLTMAYEEKSRRLCTRQ